MSERDVPSEMDSLPPAPPEMPVPRLPRPPFWLVAVMLIAVVFSWFPMVLAAVMRTTKKAEPRIAFMQDMGIQPKYREQQTSPVFADGRAMRPAIAGTVAWGHLDADDHYYRGFHTVHNGTTGKDDVVFFRGFPRQVQLSNDLLKRGQDRFNIYCSVCHGMDGSGHGPVNEQAMQLMDQGASGMSWVQAASLHQPAVVAHEDGLLFNIVSNGVRNMPGYAAQIPVADRWAIVAYVRALELSQDAPRNVLTPEQLNTLNAGQ